MLKILKIQIKSGQLPDMKPAAKFAFLVCGIIHWELCHVWITSTSIFKLQLLNSYRSSFKGSSSAECQKCIKPRSNLHGCGPYWWKLNAWNVRPIEFAYKGVALVQLHKATARIGCSKHAFSRPDINEFWSLCLILNQIRLVRGKHTSNKN